MAAAPSIDDKRVCLFTGASGTLGTEFCRLFRNRYNIAAVFRNREPDVPCQHNRIVDPLSPRKPQHDRHPVFAIKADLYHESEIRRTVELTLARFGRIDLAVNAAVHSCWAPAVATNELLTSAEQQFELNVIVPMKLAVIIAREFWRDRASENTAANRNVVNISSSAGVYVYANSDQSVYSASKAALNHLSCHMAKEFGLFGVRVNAIAPNAFPGIVPTARVANSIHRMDRHKGSGKILVIDAAGEVLYTPD
jgi:NAD(P)-dependent dehydrogenase (short-subunit alcohol dehydrogenase family)